MDVFPHSPSSSFVSGPEALARPLSGWRERGWGRYPQNTASFAGTFSVQSRVKLPAGSLETSPPILRFLT